MKSLRLRQRSHRKYMAAGCNGCGGGEHGAALNKSRRIYGDDNDTLFRLIAMARQSLGQICPAILIQMGDAKTQMDDAKARGAWVN